MCGSERRGIGRRVKRLSERGRFALHTLSPHLALAFLSKIGAKRAREADDRADRAIAARILQQDSPSTAAAVEAALRDASQGCTWREKQDMAAALAKKIEGFAPFRALQCNMDLPPRRLDYDTPPPRRACHTRGVRDAFMAVDPCFRSKQIRGCGSEMLSVVNSFVDYNLIAISAATPCIEAERGIWWQRRFQGRKYHVFHSMDAMQDQAGTIPPGLWMPWQIGSSEETVSLTFLPLKAPDTAKHGLPRTRR